MADSTEANAYGYLKHLTTLSSGALVIVATFLEKLSATAKHKWSLAACIVGMISCVLCASGAMLFRISLDRQTKVQRQRWEVTTWAILMFLTVVSFAIGVLSLGVFALLNI